MLTLPIRPLRFGAALILSITLVPLAAHAAPDTVLGYEDARHLLARTGFGPTDGEVRAFAPLTREAAVARLLAEVRTSARTPPPASAVDTTPLRPPNGDRTPAAERKAFVEQQAREGRELRAWWVKEMVATSSPLTERMTLFWHNHFVSGQPKVRITRLMYRQNVLLRSYALGNFATFLHAIAKDPAMIVYLDGARNRRGAPNENFAREVMELFTLGEGHYSEQDVKEAARAFTGWSLDRETGQFVFRPALHDYGVKTVFGHAGRFDGDDVLDLLLARPETSVYVTAKLWREFVSPEIDDAEVRRIAARFRESKYDTRVALRSLLVSDAFYARANRGVLVKSPVEFVVGTLRGLDLHPDQGLPFAVAMTGMGQNLFSPPNVKGWPGGETWINTTTLLARKQFVDRMTRSDDMSAPLAMSAPEAPVAESAQTAMRAVPTDMMKRTGTEANADTDVAATRRRRFAQSMERGLSAVHLDSTRWMAALPGATPVERAQRAERLLLPVEAQQDIDRSADAATVVRTLVLDAAYQLK